MGNFGESIEIYGIMERTMKMNNKYQLLLDEVRQNFTSVVWTHKIQEKQADIYRENYSMLESINIFAAALTSCGIVSTIFCNSLSAKIIAALLSFVTVAITTYFRSFDIKNMEKQSKDAANRLVVVRNDLLHIIAEIHMKSRSVDDINHDYIQIMNALNKIYVEAPSTTQKAVERAAAALEIDNDYTYTEEEIDHFLPPALRGKVKE